MLDIFGNDKGVIFVYIRDLWGLFWFMDVGYLVVDVILDLLMNLF